MWRGRFGGPSFHAWKGDILGPMVVKSIVSAAAASTRIIVEHFQLALSLRPPYSLRLTVGGFSAISYPFYGCLEPSQRVHSPILGINISQSPPDPPNHLALLPL